MRERWKLKEYTGTGRFNIIDDWNHQWIESLPRDEAVAKYGECEVWCHYTSGTSDIPDADGKTPSWETDVWVIIPGMTIGVSNSDNLHLRFIGTKDEATFIGKKSRQLITVKRYGRDDYSAWWRSADRKDDETAGYSCRGTAKDIIAEIYEEWFDDPNALEYWRKRVAEGGWHGVKRIDGFFDNDPDEFIIAVGYYGGGDVAFGYNGFGSLGDVNECAKVVCRTICKATGWDSDNMIYIEEEEK